MKHRFIPAGVALLLCALLLGILPGCSDSAGKTEVKTIVCSIFPQYDWVMNILGEKADEYNVLLLTRSGTDLHSYQPTVSDIATAGAADLFVYVGGVSDTWADDLIAQATNESLVSLALIDTVDAKMEKIVDGMQEDEHHHDEEGGEHDEDADTEGEHEHDEDADTEDEDEDEDEAHEHSHYDEHVWLSLKNAQRSVNAIADAICEIDPDNSSEYEANAEVYVAKLAELDTRYQSTVDAAARKTILFGDRFPFRYLADDYGLTYYAAFSGCSAETEASFETVVFLAGKVDELSLPVVLKIENSDGKIAQTIIDSTTGKSAKILTLNSCQSVSGDDIAGGMTYLSIMEDNLTVLAEALN